MHPDFHPDSCSHSQGQSETLCVDVGIVGAGPIGMWSALALKKRGLSVALLEKRPGPESCQDPRWFSLSQDVVQWLRSLGCALSLHPAHDVASSYDSDHLNTPWPDAFSSLHDSSHDPFYNPAHDPLHGFGAAQDSDAFFRPNSRDASFFSTTARDVTKKVRNVFGRLAEDVKGASQHRGLGQSTDPIFPPFLHAFSWEFFKGIFQNSSQSPSQDPWARDHSHPHGPTTSQGDFPQKTLKNSSFPCIKGVFISHASTPEVAFLTSWDINRPAKTYGAPPQDPWAQEEMPTHSHADTSSQDPQEASHVGAPPLSYMVSSRYLQEQALKALREHDIPVHFDCQVAAWHQDAWSWHVKTRVKDAAGEREGCTLRASLILGADGFNSCVAEHHVKSSGAWIFPQIAAVWTFSAMTPCVACEYFFPGGVLALLPIEGGRGLAVWMGPRSFWPPSAFAPDPFDVSPPRERQLIAVPQALQEQASACLKGHLEHPDVETFLREEGIEPPQAPAFLYHDGAMLFPIQAKWPTRCTFSRGVLLGDAAYTFHPLAGQGLNVHFRNAAQAVSHVAQHHDLGLDIGLNLRPLGQSMAQRAVTLNAVTMAMVQGFSLRHHPSLWSWTMKTLSASPWARGLLLRTLGLR